MISVLTLTYRRKHILEEAVQSFLNQDRDDCHMVVLNDCPTVKYQFKHKNVTVFNVSHRFPSISRKIEFGVKLCQNNYIYRLDDDDLLCNNALTSAIDAIKSNPGYDIYRSKGNYYFNNNKFVSVSDNVNNGNIYSKRFLQSIDFKDLSVNEDIHLTFNSGGKIHTFDDITMIYRWGMSTYHISGMNTLNPAKVSEMTDNFESSNEGGDYTLKPHFKNDYYSEIKYD